MSYSRTTMWTPEQKAAVDELLTELANDAITKINQARLRIEAMDRRPPYGTKGDDGKLLDPADCHFHYVAQGMLEDLISILHDQV